MRFSLNIDLESREGTSAVGARIINGYVEVEAQKPVLYKRVALATSVGTLGTGAGRGLFYDPGGTALYAVVGSHLHYYGTATSTLGTFTATSLTMASFAIST